MTPEDWQRVKPILDSALQLDCAQRPAFLNQACADPSLRHEIESLIAAHEEAGTGALNSTALLGSTLAKGTRLGDFQILSMLGAGGMGEVYRARDLRLERDVAIKVLPRFVSLYVRGQAYLALKHGSAAEVEFEKILNHRGIVRICETGSLARLSLARAYVVEGDTAKAKTAYQDFLTLWKDADPDIPVLKQAKAEYAKLQ